MVDNTKNAHVGKLRSSLAKDCFVKVNKRFTMRILDFFLSHNIL